MGAMAQYESDYYLLNSEEWVVNNPFKDSFDYLQRKGNGEIGKWFLSGKKGSKCYPVLEEYEDTTRVKIKCNPNIRFTIIFDFNELFTKNENNNLNIKFRLVHKGSNEGNFILDVKSTIMDENLSKIIESCDYDFNSQITKKINDSNLNADININNLKSYKYFIIQFYSENEDGYFYISDIEITGSNGLPTLLYKEYFKYRYFYESFLINDNSNENQGNNIDIATSINNNDMESNTYVSNNVLYTNEPSSVYIFNAGGILVKTENNTTSVDLSDLKKGVYIAKVNEKTIKFVR